MSTTERRVVSVVFADLVGFTALSEQLDAEDVARIQDGWFAIAQDAIALHAGQVEKFIGDAVMATFGISGADDTDVERAVRAALQVVAGTAALEERLLLAPGTVQVRVGVDTGEVVVTRDGQGWRVTGDTVNTAARLQAAAEPGQVLLGPGTAFGVAHAFVVEPQGDVALKGKSRPLRTWRVVRARDVRQRGLGIHGLHAPLLGRDAELDVLESALVRAAAGESVALLVVAPPGVGKSRLVEELCARWLARGHPFWRVRLGDESDRDYGAVARLLEGAGIPGLLDRTAQLDGTAQPYGTAGAAQLDSTASPLVATLVGRGYDAAHALVDAQHTSALLSGAVLDAEPVDLYAAWTAVLDAVSGTAPVWVVEDVHLAGPDLRAFLRHALDHPRGGVGSSC